MKPPSRHILFFTAFFIPFLLAGGWALAQVGSNFLPYGKEPARAPQRPLHHASVQVDVKGLDGKPVNGAEVRIETAKAGALSVKTDQKGRYVFKGLAAGLYKVTVLVNKVPTALDNVRARSEGPVRVEFNLQATAAGKKPKQLVWIVAQGSHIGGSWVEADESGRLVGIDGRGIDASLKTEPSARNPPIGR
jgi:hypothetical protein